jgi:predicted transport protein
MAPVYLKRYIAFKLNTNVVDIVPLESHLKLYLNCKFTDLIDSKGWCRDVTHIGSWGNGDPELKVDSESDIPYAIQLIQQVVDQQLQG